MKLKVVKQFKDKNDHKTIYQVGDVINIKEIERVTNLIKRDLCVPIDEDETDVASAQPATVAEKQPEAKKDEKSEEKEDEKSADGDKPKAGRSSRKPKKDEAPKEVEEQPEEGDANPATEEVAESEGTETKEV